MGRSRLRTIPWGCERNQGGRALGRAKAEHRVIVVWIEFTDRELIHRLLKTGVKPMLYLKNSDDENDSRVGIVPSPSQIIRKV